jgi:hypothetical protein
MVPISSSAVWGLVGVGWRPVDLSGHRAARRHHTAGQPAGRAWERRLIVGKLISCFLRLEKMAKIRWFRTFSVDICSESSDFRACQRQLQDEASFSDDQASHPSRIRSPRRISRCPFTPTMPSTSPARPAAHCGRGRVPLGRKTRVRTGSLLKETAVTPRFAWCYLCPAYPASS